MQETVPQLVTAIRGVTGLENAVVSLPLLVDDLETELGDDIQLALDTFGDALRHLSPHYKGLANILNPFPRFINTISYWVNNHQFDFIAWSPPLFRIRTPDGLALCGRMNASMPGSCADVNGQPHAVDIALLQYVLTEAQQQDETLRHGWRPPHSPAAWCCRRAHRSTLMRCRCLAATLPVDTTSLSNLLTS